MHKEAAGHAIAVDAGKGVFLPFAKDYEPYYKDTTGLENYSITYTWSVYNNFSGSGEIDFHTTTTTNTLNLEDALRANAGSAAFKGTLTVKCTVVEQASNGSFLPIITEFFDNEEEMAKFQKWREEYEEKERLEKEEKAKKNTGAA